MHTCARVTIKRVRRGRMTWPLDGAVNVRGLNEKDLTPMKKWW